MPVLPPLCCFKQKGAGSLGLTVEVLVWEIVIIWTKWSTLNGPAVYIKHLHVWRSRWHPTPVLLPGKSHGWRSLVGCSPWGHEESDTAERLRFHFSLSCIGEGNGNPLQCSCLENPRDGGDWWSAVYGISKSRTRLKRLTAAAADSPSQTVFGL